MTEPADLPPAADLRMDDLDRAANEAFPGYLVRKDLVRRYARQYPVPTYVVEFLLGRYCASVEPDEIAEGLEIVKGQLEGRTVRPAEREIFKSRAREQGSVRLIDIARARLDVKNDCYLAELPSLGLRDVRISTKFVVENERILADGFYAEVTLEYDPVIAQEKQGRPFSIAAMRPIQMSSPSVLDVLAKGRRSFGTEDWKRLLLRSTGLEPDALDKRAVQVAILRLIPFVERQLQPGRTRTARHRQESRLPAAVSVLAPALRWQGDGGEDVREHGERAARLGLPVRRGVL